MSMIQIIYLSDLANHAEAELEPIHASAVKHNRANGVTGMLLYTKGRFMQVIEGPAEAVRVTYSRIALDKRHHNIQLMAEEKITQRHFAKWSMGMRLVGDEDLAEYPQYEPYFKFGFDVAAIRARPGMALAMLQAFGRSALDSA
ncbi:BLUF domain-containing protein [Rhodoferax aquaticus]|uniref:BLUF domain-containing protein n=1 Tax=Rhodoferax aquaticus TaxID=2527691 RepID=A0A515EM98_9BURK|nr:BLUF domain-containing protein [Rhodoferax aquaticus]QDL53771.1 BLUF domain-containing protein [Rhodoferax aquaticus]